LSNRASILISTVVSDILELLFEDNFSSGDFSKHNEYFRWGRSGTIESPGS